MGIPAKAGRIFTKADLGGVVVLSSAAADKLWPGQDAVGRRLAVGPTPILRVVGIVGDIRTVGLDQPPGQTVYLPAANGFGGTRLSLTVRTTGDQHATAATITRAIRALDSEIAVPAVRSMDNVVAESVAPRRFLLNLVLGFAVLAALLAGIGIYGVASQSVAQRANEFGIRLALGARAGQIRRLVLRQAFVPIGAGLLAGLSLATVSGRVLSGLLYDVQPTNGITIGAVAGVLALVSLAAMHIPARRATRVDPMIALRAN